MSYSNYNDRELSQFRQIIRDRHRQLDELTANRKGADLMRAYHAIEMAAQLAQKRLGEIK